MIEIYDNRQRALLLNRAADPIVKGEVVKIHSWAERTSIFITLDTGYTIHLPKALVPDLVKAAEERPGG